MKKLFYTTLILCSIGIFSSCEKEEECVSNWSETAATFCHRQRKVAKGSSTIFLNAIGTNLRNSFSVRTNFSYSVRECHSYLAPEVFSEYHRTKTLMHTHLHTHTDTCMLTLEHSQSHSHTHTPLWIPGNNGIRIRSIPYCVPLW